MNIVIGAFTTVATKAAGSVIDYVADAGAGHIAYKTMNNTIDVFANKGAEYAGDMGRTVGKVVGKVAAGASLPVIHEEKKAVAGAIRTVGKVALDGSKKENKSSVLDTSMKILKNTAVVGGAVAVASGFVAATPIALGVAAVGALTDSFKAVATEVTPSEKVHFVDDVLINGVKQMAFTAAGTAAGHIARIGAIQNAYDNRVEEFMKVGNTISSSSWVPKFVTPFINKVAKIAGTVDAGRVAFSEDMIESANEAGNLVENVVTTGLQVGDAVISDAKPTDTWKDTARRTFWLGTGALGVGTLVALAPEVAAVTGGLAALGVMGKGVRWAVLKLKKPEAETVAKKTENEMSSVLDKLKPEAKLLETSLTSNEVD